MTNASLNEYLLIIQVEIFWEDLSDIYLKDILQFFILLLIPALVYGTAVKGTTVMQSLIVPSVAHCVVDNWAAFF